MKTITNSRLRLALVAAFGFMLAGCGEADEGHAHGPDTHESDEPRENTHVHADGSTHAAHEEEVVGEHAHHDDEMALAPTAIGNMTIELAQGHGAIRAGQESHLVVKLPYDDNGATIVRAWIGTDDRTLSFVGKGEYAKSHDDYDIHALAPDPLPGNAMWWVEIEKPDGTKAVGSAKPITE
jgi:hypothetical protein